MSKRKHTIRKLLERDSGICGICLSPVNALARVPHPDAASVDHIRPRCKGGAEALLNLQLSHFRCNQEKGSKILPHQAHLGCRHPKKQIPAPLPCS